MSLLVLTLAVTPAVLPPAVQEDPAEELEQLRVLGDEELREEFARACVDEGHWDRLRREELCLAEMVRRGGEGWIELLERRLQGLQQEEAWNRNDVEVLTALRRIQGAGDPLRVIVRPSRAEDEEGVVERLELGFPELPTLPVSIVNADSHAVSYQSGGDYRGGRLSRFWFELVDAEGNVAPQLSPPWGIGGGLSSRQPLEPGGRDDTLVRTGRFVVPAAPGTYRLRVHYHDRVPIADMGGIVGRITSRSDWLTFVWKPLELALAPDERARIEELVEAAAVSGKTRLFTTHHRPGGEPQELTSDPHERVFREGYEALPVLIDALDREGRTAEERSSLLALLYGISGICDPRQERGALGKVHVGWCDVGKGGSMGGGSVEGKIVPEVQERLVARWRGLRRWIVVR